MRDLYLALLAAPADGQVKPTMKIEFSMSGITTTLSETTKLNVDTVEGVLNDEEYSTMWEWLYSNRREQIGALYDHYMNSARELPSYLKDYVAEPRVQQEDAAAPLDEKPPAPLVPLPPTTEVPPLVPLVEQPLVNVDRASATLANGTSDIEQTLLARTIELATSRQVVTTAIAVGAGFSIGYYSALMNSAYGRPPVETVDDMRAIITTISEQVGPPGFLWNSITDVVRTKAITNMNNMSAEKVEQLYHVIYYLTQAAKMLGEASIDPAYATLFSLGYLGARITDRKTRVRTRTVSPAVSLAATHDYVVAVLNDASPERMADAHQALLATWELAHM